jgi:hypothetical protein
MNLSLMNNLLTIWSLSNCITLHPKHQIGAILAVDAMAICPVIPIYESGEIEGNDDLNNLISPDLFIQFVVRPKKFHGVIFQH